MADQPMNEQIERFQRLLADLEAVLDSGFFISLMGKVLVDEKRIYSVLNELRMLDFATACTASGMPAPAASFRPPENADDVQKIAYADAESIRRGANEYADKVLEDLERGLEQKLGSIKEGRRTVQSRLSK